MERNDIMALIATEFIKGAASTIVVNKSADTAMNKGRGANRNPFLGRVIIAKTYTGFVMGTDYSNSLENTASRMGNDDAEANLKDALLGFSSDELGLLEVAAQQQAVGLQHDHRVLS